MRPPKTGLNYKPISLGIKQTIFYYYTLAEQEDWDGLICCLWGNFVYRFLQEQFQEDYKTTLQYLSKLASKEEVSCQIE